MCSILGFYKLNLSSKLNSSFINDALKLMRHRGPDCEKFLKHDDFCGLGNQRLKITDLKVNANQPIYDNNYALVFNGEIYNYLDLKKKLNLKKKYKFKTKCDTEVLFQGLISSKLNFLKKLNGMFSIAFYNKKSKELFLIRDRFGIKPLYYTIENNIVYFASEIKPLLKIKKNLIKNNTYYKNFLKDTATDYNSLTAIEEIFQVQPGHYIKFSKKRGVQEKKWYYFNDYKFNFKIFEKRKKTLSFFENLLVDSIRTRINSEVPICLTMSGGVDSTVIYTLIKERLKKKISIFSLEIDKAALNESKIVNKLLLKYNDNYHSVKLKNSNNIKNLEDKIRSLEFPIWDTSSIAYAEVYKKISRKGFKIVIEGHGSDEQLGGYPYLIDSAILTYLFKFRLKDFFSTLKYATSSVHKSKFMKIYFLFFQTIKNFLKKLIKKEPFLFDSKVKSSFDYKILPIELRAFDRLTMMYSIENRCPFLDYRVVEFLRKMPMEYKINSLGSKAILREILKKYENNFVYENSKKIGFGSDIENFLKVNKKELENKIFNLNINIIKKKKYLKLLRSKYLNESKYVNLLKDLQVSIFNKIFNLKNY